jgi:hypothetical protein
MDKATIDALNVDADTIDGLDSAALEVVANKNQANGYAGLGPDGKIPDGLIPALAIGEPFVVGSEAEMLALAAQKGDVAKRTDEGKSYILGGDGNPATLANWIGLDDSVDGVQSVAGTAPINSTGGLNPVISLNDDGVLRQHIAPDAVGTTEIEDGTVTDAKIVSVSAAKVTGAIRKAALTVGDGAATVIVVNHALGTKDVAVSVRDAATDDEVLVDTKHTDADNVTLTFSVAPAANSIRVVVVG